jgi:hypothetical protein
MPHQELEQFVDEVQEELHWKSWQHQRESKSDMASFRSD